MTDYRKLLYEGSDVWNAARKAEPTVYPDLSGISLSRRADYPDLSHYDFSKAVLKEAKIGKLHLSYSSLADADCRGAQFSGLSLDNCDLTEADFRYTRLFNCYLRHADLTGADFTGALFSNVDVHGAIVSGTNFGNIDLSRTSNLDRLQHQGPVVIGAGGLRESNGRVPRTFLEKAGVHEDLVRAAMRWAKQPIRYHKCFISYASEDRRFVSELRNQLIDSGVDRAFVAASSLNPGDRYVEVIRNEIASAGCIVVVLSRHALRSDWVAREVDMAFEGERPGGPAIVIPLALISPDEWDGTTLAWARRLRGSFHAISYWRARPDVRKRHLLTLLSALRRTRRGK